MPFNTFSVATAVTPSVLETYFTHYLNRSPLRGKPTAHISYHEGLRLIRQFLEYSSRHTVEELQAFTSQWVPVPTWVRTYDLEIAPQFLERSAAILQAQLGRRGLEKIGGKTWWQWRRPEAPLRAEWIEMKKDFHERKKTGARCERCILYVHGGAYYFGSVDEHRYQMQRHARKLKARVLAPRYRLAPQFPFPCGLQDCIATYLYLLQHFPPEQILFAGDSAGGGMVLSLMVTLRDQGMPLPAGTILLSPWSDLTHSFPSVAGDGAGDYIPAHGFHHKPSMAWPPPPTDDAKKRLKRAQQAPSDAVELPAMEVDEGEARRKMSTPMGSNMPVNSLPGLADNLSILLDGQKIELREQIQMYAPNDLLAHPLVSPVLQPSLGGLPPMLVQVGGAELLRDEQIYLAHKAANPKAYPPGEAIMREYDPRQQDIESYPPTDVHLQVWEDLCHVPHTLSFTRPAKYMYRSVAQFGAWALANAQHRGVDASKDADHISIISDGPEEGGAATNASSTDLRQKQNGESGEADNTAATLGKVSLGAVGRAGDPIPPFKDHMIRQRVTRHGVIYNLAPASEIACLALDPATIGTIKQGPVRKWLAKRKENEARFGNDAKKLAKKKAKEAAAGYDEIPGEDPPPTALVNRRRKGVSPEEKKKQKNWGLAMWSGWGSAHDEDTIKREDKAEKDAESRQASLQVPRAEERPPKAGPGDSAARSRNNGHRNHGYPDDKRSQRRTSSVSLLPAPWSQKQVVDQRPRSPYRQATGSSFASGRSSPLSNTPARSRRSSTGSGSPAGANALTAAQTQPQSVAVPGSENTFLHPHRSRPHDGVHAYPFKLGERTSNPSLATLDSRAASDTSSQAPGIGVAPVEMPTSEDNHFELPTHADDHIEMPTPADQSAGDVSPVDDVIPFPAPRATGRAATSNPSSSPPSTAAPSLAPTLSLRNNAHSGDRNLQSTRSPPARAAGHNAEAPMLSTSRNGPLRGPDSNDSRSNTPQFGDNFASPIDSPQSIPPLKGRTAIFNNRSSVLGALGADGMPLVSPLQARNRSAGDGPRGKTPNVIIPDDQIAGTQQTSDQESEQMTPVTPVDAQKAALDRIRGNPSSQPADAFVETAGDDPVPTTAADENDENAMPPFKIRSASVDPRLVAGSDKNGDSVPVTPVDGQQPMPFKIRNPVFDSRAPGSAPAAQDAPAEKRSPSGAAPFKMRSAVYDPPSVATNAASTVNSEALPHAAASDSEKMVVERSASPSEAEKIAARAMTPVEPQRLPPHSNVVMPTVVSHQPMLRSDEDAPPPPPPKDDVTVQ